MMYPLVRELAVDGVPVTVTCRVLKISRQPYCRWLVNPVTDAELTAAYRANALFDAHREDDLGQLALVEQDYVWITQRLMDVARRHAKGRIVSVLEGGYNLSALARSVEAHVRVLADL